jgi:hypothetical protein
MRLTEELRGRTKRYASAVIRVYVRLPKSRKEVEVFSSQHLSLVISACQLFSFQLFSVCFSCEVDFRRELRHVAGMSTQFLVEQV